VSSLAFSSLMRSVGVQAVSTKPSVTRRLTRAWAITELKVDQE